MKILIYPRSDRLLAAISWAHIKTPNHRPQMATVRYKIMNAPERAEKESGEIVVCTIEKEKLLSHVRVLDIVEKAEGNLYRKC